MNVLALLGLVEDGCILLIEDERWGSPIWVFGMWRSRLLCWFSTTFLLIVVEDTISEFPQVCTLWFGVGKGMLPVRHLAQKILMAVNFFWRHLARRLGLAAHAYLRKVSWICIVQVI